MNPWLYFATIPIINIMFQIGIISVDSRFLSITQMMLLLILILILLLLLSVYLYINNIIGLFDLIALILIFGINLFILIVYGKNMIQSEIPSFYYVSILLLPILATITSFIYNLN